MLNLGAKYMVFINFFQNVCIPKMFNTLGNALEMCEYSVFQ